MLVEELQEPERGQYVNMGDAQGITALFLALQKGTLSSAWLYSSGAALHCRYVGSSRLVWRH